MPCTIRWPAAATRNWPPPWPPRRSSTATDLMAALGIPPGREVGRLLALVREAQLDGEVADPEAALELARRAHGIGFLDGCQARC